MIGEYTTVELEHLLNNILVPACKDPLFIYSLSKAVLSLESKGIFEMQPELRPLEVIFVEVSALSPELYTVKSEYRDVFISAVKRILASDNVHNKALRLAVGEAIGEVNLQKLLVQLHAGSVFSGLIPSSLRLFFVNPVNDQSYPKPEFVELITSVVEELYLDLNQK